MPYMEDCLDWPLSTVLPLLQQRIMEGSSYHGIPTMKSPLDFWIYQEILWETRPAFIIEIGNLYGGSTLALAHACDALGKGKIIGNLDEQFSQLVRRCLSLVFHDLLKFLPAGFVPLNKCRFPHDPKLAGR